MSPKSKIPQGVAFGATGFCPGAKNSSATLGWITVTNTFWSLASPCAMPERKAPACGTTIVSNASRTSSAMDLCSESLIASTNGLRTRFTFLLSHRWSRSAPGCEKLSSAFAIVPKNAPTSRRNSGVCLTRFERSAISPGSQLKTRTACNRLSPLEPPEGSSRYATSSRTGVLFFSFMDPMKFNDAFVRMGTGAGTLCFCRWRIIAVCALRSPGRALSTPLCTLSVYACVPSSVRA
mmetsp:Transcript_10900/g.45786  ORF Transcript_10900/g.45786 Transcript_10900/m.45786 type:complete len:236 (+) Transcript_10900:925-1632(+)